MTRPLYLLAIPTMLILPALAAADAGEPRSFRYVAGAGLDVAGEHAGSCNGAASVGDAQTPARGGVCLDLAPGTYTVNVTDDVLGPVGFTLQGESAPTPFLTVGPLVVETVTGCGVSVHAVGQATITLPEACVGLDIHVDAGSLAGTIAIA